MSLKNDHYDEIDDDNNDSKDENDNICFNNFKKLKTENKGKMHLQVAMEVLGWHKQEVCDILTSQMQVAPLLSDQNWATKRLRNVKFTSVHAVLLTLGQVCLFNSSTIKLQENYLFKIVNMPNTHFNKIPVS